MATIARSSALAAALGPEGLLGPQVWLDPDHGLVGGVFPAPAARFDFVLEVAAALTYGQAPSSAAAAPKTFVSLLSEARRVSQICEIETSDAVYRVGSTTHMLIVGLDLIEERRPGTLEKLSARKKQTKRPVARTRAGLYDSPHPESHSAALKCGWFVATNNKAAEARGVLRKAVDLAGLKWGSDFAIRHH